MTEGILVWNPRLHAKLHKVGDSVIDKPRLPIYSDLPEVFAGILQNRVKAGYQNVVAVVGGTGSGKSAWALNECYLMDPYFLLEGNYIYTNADLAAKLSQPPDAVSKINWFDEGSVILNSNRHGTRESTDVVVLFDTLRSRGMTSFICIPELRSLNNRIRDDHVDFLVVCGEKSPIPGYSKRGFFKLFQKSKPSTFKTSVFWQPLAWGIYKMPRPALWREYQDYKKEAQRRLVEDFISRNGDEEEAEA